MRKSNRMKRGENLIKYRELYFYGLRKANEYSRTNLELIGHYLSSFREKPSKLLPTVNIIFFF